MRSRGTRTEGAGVGKVRFLVSCFSASHAFTQRVCLFRKRARADKGPECAESTSIGADHGSRHVYSQFRLVAVRDDGLAAGGADKCEEGTEITRAHISGIAQTL